MTPKPPSSAEGSSLPPRHRQALGSIAQDTTEQDLWAFDEEVDLADAPGDASTGVAPRSFAKEIPVPRERQVEKPRGDSPGSRAPVGEDQIRIHVKNPAVRMRPTMPATVQAAPEGEFDDLEHWEPVPTDPELVEGPANSSVEGPERENPEPLAEENTPAPSGPHTVATAKSKEEPGDEFSPVVPEHAVPVSLRPHLGLSKVERIGLILLLVLLVAGAAATLIFSLNWLPTDSLRAHATHFPVKGDLVTVDSATGYWREPIMEGPSRDTFRLGTQLLPVLELTVSGGPAAIQVLFRNEERVVVGDAVTRTVRGGDTLKIPATAGFDDLGMHAAYRTGESKPWTIEVLEAPSADAAGTTYKKLFELNISPERR